MFVISIIIPACNEEKYIGKTLDSIFKQNYRKYEIIVVCNGCDDKTYEIVKPKADIVLNFPWRNIAKARNEGAKVAKYDKLVFLDADTKLIGDVLKKIATTEFVIGTCKFKPDSNKIKHRTYYFIKSHLLSPLLKITNGILFTTKNHFIGFDENLKKGEEGNLLRKTLKLNNAKFTVLNEYVESSTRRYERLGYLNIIWYWIKERLKPSDEDYSIIR